MSLPLPPYAHIPGQNPRHAPELFDTAKASALKITRSATAEANPAWRYGLELLAAGFYWECHEVLETVWMNAPPNSRERAAVQGVIQLANAALKREMNRPKAALRLVTMASGHFADATSPEGQIAMELQPDKVEESLRSLRGATAVAMSLT